MQIKDGVKTIGLAIEMRIVEKYAEEIWKQQGVVTDLGKQIDLATQGTTITSALEGTHSAGSLHRYGYALDFRTRYFTKEQVMDVAEKLYIKLKTISRYYEVVVEKDHIHVEYDVGNRLR